MESDKIASIARSAVISLFKSLSLFLGGAVFLYAFAPFSLFHLIFAYPVFLLMLSRDATPRRAFLRTWLLSWGLFSAAVYWVYFSMGVYNKIPLPLVTIMITGLGAYLALFPAFASSLTVKLGVQSRPRLLLVVFPALFVLFEWLRGWFLTGFPWLTLGYSQTDTVLAGLAPVLGVYGVSAVIVFTSTVIYWLLRNYVRETLVLFVAYLIGEFLSSLFHDVFGLSAWLSHTLVWGGLSAVLIAYAVRHKIALTRKRLVILVLLGLAPGVYLVLGPAVMWIYLALATILFSVAFRQWIMVYPVVLISACALLGFVKWGEIDGKPVTVSMLQGNMSQDIKWNDDMQAETFKRYLGMTRAAKDSDLVIWPETSVPDRLDNVKRKVVEPIQKFIDKNGKKTEVLFGVLTEDTRMVRGKRRYYTYNSAIKLGGQRQRYDKSHLVPFGEYMPLHDLLGPLAETIGMPQGAFARRKAGQPLMTIHAKPVQVNICYEIAFGHEIIRSLPEARYIINLSNNAWFYDPRKQKTLIRPYTKTNRPSLVKFWFLDSTETYQQLQMAQFRAMETSRYVLSATNDGATAVIDERGRIINSAPRFVQYMLTTDIQPRKGKTLYVLWGNYAIVGLLCLLLITGIGISRLRK
jgi:apolipoprotein N-acyltransferase